MKIKLISARLRHGRTFVSFCARREVVGGRKVVACIINETNFEDGEFAPTDYLASLRTI